MSSDIEYQNIIDIGHISVFLRRYNIPIDSYSRLIIGYLIENETVSEDKIIEFGIKLGIDNLDKIMISEALHQISENNIIYFRNGEYYKNPKAFYFKDIRDQSSKLYNKMQDEIITKISQEINIDDNSKIYIKSVIRGVFNYICKKRAKIIENIYRFNGNSQLPFDEHNDLIEEAVQHISNKWKETNAYIEQQEKIDNKLYLIIKDEFLSPSKTFSQGFDIFYRGFLLIQSICLDPQQKIINEFDYKIFLDTNVLVACSIASLEQYNLISHLIDKLNEIGKVNILQANTTKVELKSLIHATKINLLDNSSPLTEYANNEIYHIYEKCYKNDIGIEKFFKKLNETIENLIKEKLIEEYEIDIDKNKKTFKDYKQIELVVESFRRSRKGLYGSFAVDHDVNLLIETLKDPDNKKIILTRSYRLYSAANYLKKKDIIKRNPVFHVTHFIDFLSPFLSANQPEDISETIIKLIGCSIIPERREIELVDYLSYVCQELMISEKDTKKIIDKIIDTHLKEELQIYLDQRNLDKLFPVLLTTIGNLVDEDSIVERHQDILNRVIGRKMEKEFIKFKEEFLSKMSDVVSNFVKKQDVTNELNYSSIRNQLTAISQIINDIKHIIEFEHGWKLLWEGDEHKNESDIQEILYFLFRSLGKAKKIQVYREPNIGSGRIDFIFSGSYEMQIYLELKLSDNEKIKHAIETQIPTYYRAGKIENGYLLIIEFGELEQRFKDELEELRNEINKKRAVDTNIIYINGNPQKTASKKKLLTKES